MISIGDALLKLGVDKTQFDASITAARQHVEQNMGSIQTALRITGGAFLALGVAGMKIVSDFRKLNAELSQTGLTIGVSASEMRNLALEVTDVTFPLKSVAATFELLARAGMTSTYEIKNAANAFDALADATGSSAEALADLLLPAFKLFGETIPTTSAELDKFTWLTKNTLVDLTDFGTLLTRMAPYMDELSMSMEDAIATLAALSEQGITGTAATLRLRTAITQAADTGQSLNAILKISQEEIDGFKQKMNGAVGITDKYAEVASTQFTLMDKLKQKWEELGLKIGDALKPFEGVLAVMTLLGPVMLVSSMLIPKLVLAFKGLSIQMIITKWHAIAMWGAITLGISAVIMGIVELIQNWEHVVNFFKKAWDITKWMFLKGTKAILDALSLITKFIPGLNKAVDEAREKLQNMIDETEIKLRAEIAIEASKGLIVALEKEKKALAEKHEAELAAIDETYGAYKEIAAFKKQETLEAQQVEMQALDEQIIAAREAHAELLRGEQGYTDELLEELNTRIAVRRKAIEQERTDALAFYNEEKQFLIDYYGVYENYIKDIEDAKSTAAQKALDYRLQLLAIEGKAIETLTNEEIALIREQMDAERDAYAERIGLLGFEIDYRETLMDSARRATEERATQLDLQMDAEREAYNERIRMIDEEYNAQMRAIDASAAAQIKQLQDQIDMLRGIDKEEDRLRETAADEEKKQQLERVLALAQTDLQRMRAQEALNAFLEELAIKQAKYERDAKIDSLQDQITAVRENTNEQKNALAAQRDAKIRAEQEQLVATLSRLEDEKKALDQALLDELNRLETERREADKLSKERLDNTLTRLEEEDKALTEHLAEELKKIKQQVQDINAYISRNLKQNYTVYVNVVTTSSGGGGGVCSTAIPTPAPTPIPPKTPVVYAQHGGLIPEPTLLTSLRTMRPYAVAGERGPEWITPGGQRADIHIYLDGYLIAEAIGEPLVDIIRVKTGVKI